MGSYEKRVMKKEVDGETSLRKHQSELLELKPLSTQRRTASKSYTGEDRAKPTKI